MNKMAKLLGRGKWAALVAAIVACGGVDAQFGPDGSGGATPEAVIDAAGAPAGGAVAVAPMTQEAGHAGSVAADDGGSAGEVSACAAGAPSEPVAGAGSGSGGGGAGGASGSAAAQGGAPVGGQPGGGGDSGGQAGASGGSAGGPACVCSTGQCCDGCQFRPSSYFLGALPRTSSCSNVPPPSLAGSAIYLEIWNVFCTGTSATDQRWGAHVNETATQCPYKWTCVDPDHLGTPTSAVCMAP